MVHSRCYGRWYVKKLIPLCTFLKFHTHLEENLARSFQNVFFKGLKSYIFKKFNFSWKSSYFRVPSGTFRASTSVQVDSHVKLVEILANKFCPSAVVPALQYIWYPYPACIKGTNKSLLRLDSSFSFMPYYPSDLKSLSPTNAVKICAMNVQTWSTRNHLCDAAPTSPSSFPDQSLTLHYCQVWYGSVLSLCVLLILLRFPVGKTR